LILQKKNYISISLSQLYFIFLLISYWLDYNQDDLFRFTNLENIPVAIIALNVDEIKELYIFIVHNNLSVAACGRKHSGNISPHP
jgi:hypothetical protein